MVQCKSSKFVVRVMNHDSYAQTHHTRTSNSLSTSYMRSPPHTYCPFHISTTTQQLQAKDLERFQREKRKVIKALKHVKGDLASLEGTKYVTRGFEGYQTIEFNRIVRKQRRAVVESVMSVQRQRKETKQQQLRQQQKLHEENNGGGKADHYYCVPHCVMEQDDLEDAVAHAARQESAWARELAHQMGLKDEETVRLGWQEFFAEVAVDGELSNSDSETSLSSLSVQDCPTSNIFDHMHFEHVTCVVENCTTFVA